MFPVRQVATPLARVRRALPVLAKPRAIRPSSTLRAGLSLVLAAAVPGLATAQAIWQTSIASTDASGAPSNNWSESPTVSADGRFVAFSSSATNLVPNDTNNKEDCFVKDMSLGTTVRVSVSSAGSEANGHSGRPFISRDGTMVVFQAGASNLVLGDSNGATDIFLRDLTTSSTIRVSVANNGQEADADSAEAFLSANKRYVGFRSYATNLVPGGTRYNHAYVRDLQVGTTILVSVNSLGQEGNRTSNTPFITDNGRYAVFTSYADNLIPNDVTPYTYDVYLRDIVAGTTSLVSSNSQGIQGGSTSLIHRTQSPISDDGRFVAFASNALNFPPFHGAGWRFEAYVKDLKTGTLTQVNVNSQGVPDNVSTGRERGVSISGDGRFVVFESEGTNLDPIATTPGIDKVFIRDTLLGVTKLVSVNNAGAEGDGHSSWPGISPNGRYVVFASQATNFASGTTGLFTQIFRHDRGETPAFVDFRPGACGANDLPYIGSTSPVLGIRNGFLIGDHIPATTVGFIILGLPQQPPIPLGPACAIHVDPIVNGIFGVVQSNALGQWSFPFSIPGARWFQGARFALQAVFPSSSTLGFDLTDGVVWNLGH